MLNGSKRARLVFAYTAALAILGSLAALACGDDGDDPVGAAGGDFEAVEVRIGAVLPETGGLGPLGVPIIEGVKLAVADINAAGGNVTVTFADSGTNPDTAKQAVSRLLGEGNKLIIGAAASGVTQAFIQSLYDQKIPQCSPSATSPSFTTQANATYFFRTVPPDEGVAPVLADEVVADGGTRVALVARADDYGKALSDLVAKALDDLGADHETFLYDPAATTFDSVVDSVVGYRPDAVVNIGFFFDGTRIIKGLIEAGIPADVQYGGDGLFLPSLPKDVDPNNANILDGMKVIGAAGTKEFNDRLTEITDGNLIYGGGGYDCTVLLALAAQIAGGTDDGDAILEAVSGLTQGGEVCTSYRQCAEMIADGKDVDYEGASGPLNLSEPGDPTIATYAISAWEDGKLVPLKSQQVDLAR